MKILSIISFLLLSFVGFSQSSLQPIKGTWITNVGSDALLSEKNIKNSVALCKAKGINTIFVVVWNNGVTMYPSKVLRNYIGFLQDTVYKGFDPIACIVKEGHAQGLKVHAWFEFGFSYAYKDSASIWNKKYLHWAGRNNKKLLLQKNGFYWWSSIHPEVQNFMLQLIEEVVKKYKVDGVQGDDRLPAMPAEGGYDDYTLALYKSATGNDVPDDYKEKNWLQFKADQLSIFGKKVYQSVKKIRKDCMVTWSPSIYPWSKEQYLQDWPQWLQGGYADAILPQLYRYDLKAYEKILLELKKQIPPTQQYKIFPGILTSLADGYLIKNEMLQSIIQLNRANGFSGECLFYFETLKKIDTIY
jgi:uncharacterized lipoprotein YddW (UPF0748 family)